MRILLALTAALMVTGCASVTAPESASTSPQPEPLTRGYGAPVAAIAGGLMMLSDLKLFKLEYIAGGLVAFALYDPFAPTWRIEVREAGKDRIRMALRMKSLFTGGDGEARQVFLRNARELTEAGGFVAYEIVHYEEGIESSRPFAHRYANAEIQLVRSHIFPTL